MSGVFPPLILAAQLSTLERLSRVPKQVWINFAICVVAAVIVVRLWRGLRKFNAFTPWLAAAVAGTIILSYWTYERTEPAFLTPVVERLTFFLPTKAKHEADLEKVRKGRDADIR